MKKKSLVALTILGALASLTFSCKTSPTEPERRIKTPREMTWTADTLPVPEGAIQVLPEDLLVLSPTDIYLATWVGHGVIMYYNGSTWTKVLDSGGINCLAGTTTNDIWAGGYTGNPNGEVLISHYDGVQWKNVSTGVKGELLDMTQDPEGNMWACGRNGVILKYDKTKWIADTIKIAGFSQNDCYLYSVNYYNGKIYILARNDANTLFAYVSGDIKNWVVKEIFPKATVVDIIKWGTLGSYSISNAKLYSYGLTGIWQLGSSGWSKILDSDIAIRNICGSSENYIVGVGAFKTILFFDGSSWQSVSDMIKVNDPYFAFNNVWTNGYETFIAGYTVQGYPQKTIIFHGK